MAPRHSPTIRGLDGESVSSPRSRRWAIAVFFWALTTHLAYLAGELFPGLPVSPLFFADGFHFFTKARLIAEGTSSLGSDLPFHPPSTSWLLVPFWHLLGEPKAVGLAAKVLMATLNAATFALVYLLLRRHLPTSMRSWALPVAWLLPLGFGELQLSAAVNSESVYRLLLVLLLLLGRRLPLLAGLLHGAAALTRAEHLPVALLLGGALFLGPRRGVRTPTTRRRDIAFTALGAALLVVPYAVLTHGHLVAYNEAHAGRLAQPLPVWVPVSFYGPLNFALAQREDEIFFSRRTLPASGDQAALDPRHPMHNAYIVDGYRIGLARIGEDPVRFLRRSWAKLGHSLRAFGQGWTWRDVPKPPRFTRRPIDMSHGSAPLYEAAVAGLAIFGGVILWRRGGGPFLAVGMMLLVYRLSINVTFFPYLRGMMIGAPFVMTLLLLGGAEIGERLGGRFHRSGWGQRTLVLLLAALAVIHLSLAWRTRDYALRGERDAAGKIIDDRTVELEWRGFR